MPTYKSKAEERRYGERFSKQLAGLRRTDEIAAARDNLVAAAMAWWRIDQRTDVSSNEVWEKQRAAYAACAALAKLEG
jgi:hypothetical protein